MSPPTRLSTPARRAGRIRRCLRAAGALACAGLLLGALLVAIRPWFWLGEIVAAFDWYLGWGGVAGAALLGLGGARRWAAAAVVVAAWVLAPSLWLYVPRGEPRAGAELGVATINLRYDGRDARRLRELLADAPVDVIAFQEVTGFWLDALEEEPLATRFPHRLAWPPEEERSTAMFGILLASRLPLRSAAVRENADGLPALEAQVQVGERAVHVVCAHPCRPGRAYRITARNAQLAALEESIDWSPTTVLLGDLNTSSRSPAFARLLAATGLRDSRRGFGRQPSWRSGPEIRLPGPLRGHTPELWTDLDHVLVGAEIDVVERWIGADIGSDHRPVLARLRLAGADRPGPR